MEITKDTLTETISKGQLNTILEPVQQNCVEAFGLVKEVGYDNHSNL